MATLPDHEFGTPPDGWRLKLHRIIYESDTRAGRLFDQVIVGAILVSVAVVIADSVFNPRSMSIAFTVVEWFFTILFTVEYIARLVSVRRQLRSASSASSTWWRCCQRTWRCSSPSCTHSSTCASCGCCASSASSSWWSTSRTTR